MAPNRIIIDTDPGVDDVLAMLLALSSKPDELDILMLSVQFGNVDVQNAEKIRTVAIGAEEPLAEQMLVADFFHGIDGLGGIHHNHPHLSPTETWKSLFKPAPENMTPEENAELQAVKEQHSLFTPSLKPAHQEILRILRENEPDTVSIIAIGPLTNLAIAAATDPESFLRVKEVVVMGGAVDAPGNMTPGAEFNTYADSVAAARLFALTSPNPSTTIPPTLTGKGQLPHYPEKLPRQLKLKLFPLDITSKHKLTQSHFNAYTDASAHEGSPLANWARIFVTSTFQKISSINPNAGSNPSLELHDPLTIWYCLTSNDPSWKFITEDIRVETAGQWTRGTCVVDRRPKMVKEGERSLTEEVVGDAGGWLDSRKGNRLDRCAQSPGTDLFAKVLLERVFGDLA